MHSSSYLLISSPLEFLFVSFLVSIFLIQFLFFSLKFLPELIELPFWVFLGLLTFVYDSYSEFSTIRSELTMILVSEKLLFPFVILVFYGSTTGKESTCNAGDPGLFPGSGISAGEGDKLPTPIFLGFPGGSDGKESGCNVGPGFDLWVGEIPLKKGMAIHCSILAWRIPWADISWAVLLVNLWL